MLDLRCDLPFHLVGGRARTTRVSEDVKIADGQLVQKLIAAFKVFVAFGREAGDDIEGNTGVRNLLLDGLYLVGKDFRGVAAFHQVQDLVQHFQ